MAYLYEGLPQVESNSEVYYGMANVIHFCSELQNLKVSRHVEFYITCITTQVGLLGVRMNKFCTESSFVV